MQILETTTLDELKAWDQWVCWRYEERNGKRAKVPLSTHGRFASVRDPHTWTSFENAQATTQEHGYHGVGFVFTEDDPYCGVDLDGCLDPETGEIEPWALVIVDSLDSYTEISPSGTGVHIIVRGSLPDGPIKHPHVEMYDSGRYFTFTARRLAGTTDGIQERQHVLDTWTKPKPLTRQVRRKPTPSVGEIIEKARNARNGERFRALYDHGNTSGYASHSEADYALMLMLAFWFAANPESMEAAFNESALRQREKWTRNDYRLGTIQKALEKHNGKVYQHKTPPPPDVLERLASMRTWSIRHEWRGRNAARNRYAYQALMDTGVLQGEEHPEGIKVRAGLHYLALKAGISDFHGMMKAISDLESMGLIAVLDRGRDGFTTNTYLLRAQMDHSINPCVLAVVDLCPLLQRVRENGSGFAGGEVVMRSRDHHRTVAHVIQLGLKGPIVKGSIGKRGAYLIEKIILEGGHMSKKKATRLMGARKPNALMERIARPATKAGLLIHDEDTGELSIPHDLKERLERHLEDTGCLEAERRQLHYVNTRADKAPSDTDLEGNRERMREVLELREREAIERADEEERRKVGMTARGFILEAISGTQEGFHWPSLRDQWKAKGGNVRRLQTAANTLKAESRLKWWKPDTDGDWYIKEAG